MFEDSLVESCGQLASGRRRWITVGSVAVQGLIAAGIVAVPLLHPEALSFRTLAPAIVVPPMRKPPVVVVEKRLVAASSAASFAPRIEQMEMHTAILPSMRPVDGPEPVLAEPGFMRLGAMVGPGGGVSGLVGVPARRVAVVAAPKQALSVSSGVSAGLLLGEIRPAYPRIAVAAHVQGVVVIEATISKMGTIESAHVLRGPAMLAGAAIEAVRAARYRPYLLNGEATEVRTTVTVNFRLGDG